MDKYELTVIMPGKTTPARLKAFSQKLEKLIAALKGKISEEKNWGTMDLTYKIKKEEKGVFVLYLLELEKSVVKKLNESFRTDDLILRHLLVKAEVAK